MINCMTKWISKWKTNEWKLSTGESVKNIPDLKYLDSLCSKIIVNWVS
jgi:ribonuclease HI